MQDQQRLSAMELTLARAGYETVFAMNAQHALRDLGSIPAVPVGVMLDADIPRPALITLVKAIASRPGLCRVPILFIRHAPRARPY